MERRNELCLIIKGILPSNFNIKHIILFSLVITISCKDNKKELEFEEKKSKIPFNETGNSINFDSLKINIDNNCGYNYDFKKAGLKVNSPGNREIDIIEEIFSYSGLPSNFILYEADIQNAIATIIDDQRYIIYDSDFLENVDKSSMSYWSSISILAHEIGHHLSGHTLLMKSSKHSSELDVGRRIKFAAVESYPGGGTINNGIWYLTYVKGLPGESF